MQIYYPSLDAIQQKTMQLDGVPCVHCQKTQQLVSHGFIYKKRTGCQRNTVGKRVYCSNRRQHTGCGRTLQLYVATTVRYYRYAGEVIVAFILALLGQATIPQSYRQATGQTATRNSYCWLKCLHGQLSHYRSVLHALPLPQNTPTVVMRPPTQKILVMGTITALLQQYGQPLCAAYQLRWQRPFLAKLP